MKKLKFTFIYPDFEYRVDPTKKVTRIYTKGGWYNEGIAQLAAVVEKEGWEVDMIHMLKPFSKDEFLKEIRKRNPDVVGMNVRTDVYPYCQKIAGWLKNSKIHVMAGSYHPTIYPDEVIKWDGLDSLVIGEAENPLMQFLRRFPNLKDYKIGSFWFKLPDGMIIKNPVQPFVQDLDSLPFPKFDLFDFSKLLSSNAKNALAMITRGCPYRCTYCWNNYHASIYPKKYKFVRHRSASNAIEYLKRLRKAYPEVTRFRFLDDILPMYTDWKKDFKEKYIKEIHTPFSCNFRANFLDLETAKMLKEMGCLLIFFGVESGNNEILNKVLKRGMPTGTVEKAFANCRKVEIKTIAYNIIGIPNETPKNMIETMKLNARIKPTQVIPMIFCPYPGTELTEIAIKAGYYDKNQPRDQFVSCKMKQFPPDHVLFAASYFREFVKAYQIAYRLPNPFGSLFMKIIDKIFLSNLMPRKSLNFIKIKYTSLRNKFIMFIKSNFKFLYIFLQQKVMGK